jgi:hypothetical protein
MVGRDMSTRPRPAVSDRAFPLDDVGDDWRSLLLGAPPAGSS